jgi:hypothetical protein
LIANKNLFGVAGPATSLEVASWTYSDAGAIDRLFGLGQRDAEAFHR